MHYEEGVVLADDENGRQVHITVLFVSKTDLQKLTSLKNPEIKVSFDIIKRDVSGVFFYLSASSHESYTFLR